LSECTIELARCLCPNTNIWLSGRHVKRCVRHPHTSLTSYLLPSSTFFHLPPYVNAPCLRSWGCWLISICLTPPLLLCIAPPLFLCIAPCILCCRCWQSLLQHALSTQTRPLLTALVGAAAPSSFVIERAGEVVESMEGRADNQEGVMEGRGSQARGGGSGGALMSEARGHEGGKGENPWSLLKSLSALAPPEAESLQSALPQAQDAPAGVLICVCI